MVAQGQDPPGVLILISKGAALRSSQDGNAYKLAAQPWMQS
jgi:hypothetical protein